MTIPFSIPKEVPFQFVLLWQTSNEPWGFKDKNLRYIYVNQAFCNLLDLPLEKIQGKLDSELEHVDFARFAPQFEEQERLAIQSKRAVSSVETHCFGGGKHTIQPYHFEKTPIFDQKDVCLGVMLHAQKMRFFTTEHYLNGEAPFELSLEKPGDFFTDEEFRLVCYLVQDQSPQYIAEKLQCSEEDVEAFQHDIYRKTFKAFCKEKGYDRYVPQSLFEPNSQTLPFYN